MQPPISAWIVGANQVEEFNMRVLPFRSHPDPDVMSELAKVLKVARLLWVDCP